MDNASPMGSLSSLPAEVRIEIYRLVLPRQSRAILPISSRFRQTFAFRDTAIFCCCKATNREAVDVFYSGRFLMIGLGYFTEMLNATHYLAHPGLPLIQNVHFIINTMLYDENCKNKLEYQTSVCRDIILGFSGLETPRNTLRLTLWIDVLRDSDLGVMEPAFFQDLATMTRFRKVVIEIKPPWGPSPSSIKYTAWHENLFESAGDLVSMIVEKVAPSLGPGVVEVRQTGCYVEFQPRAHLAGQAAGKRHLLL